ncbi:hypothetical protein CQW23_15753 [Capsicum baccatum]|uniref:Gnk2-homologous domain-containing protein n=1 Tax=Capsicum baccatum TaxID=33114 RepID=A0A2G2WMX4_CAPBA|nr:hypothetical protein CQW23_15753 [Capsicum baccatum]
MESDDGDDTFNGEVDEDDKFLSNSNKQTINQMIIDASTGNLIDKLTGTTMVNGGYASMHLSGVYGLAQCWKNLSSKGCRECLDKASRDFKGCILSRDARALIVGCYLRYSTQNFVNNISADSRKNLSLPSRDWQRRRGVCQDNDDGVRIEDDELGGTGCSEDGDAHGEGEVKTMNGRGGGFHRFSLRISSNTRRIEIQMAAGNNNGGERGTSNENASTSKGAAVPDKLVIGQTKAALQSNNHIADEWTPEEQSALEELLDKYATENEMHRYAQIARQLKDKGLRDVILRCIWMSDVWLCDSPIMEIFMVHMLSDEPGGHCD